VAEIQSLKARLDAQAPKETAPASEILTEPTRDKFDTDVAYFAALRKYDQQVLEQKDRARTEQQATAEAQQEWNRRVADHNSRLAEAKKRYPDWDEKLSKDVGVGREGDADYNTIMAGVLMDAGPDTLYALASKPSEARSLAKLDVTGLVAVSNSDDIGGVVVYLASHPEDVAKLNGMNPVKAQAYVGKIEARIESAKAEKPADTTQRTSSGDTATQPKADKGSAVPIEEKAPPKAKPEPPPPLRGAAVPSVSDWREPAVMSLAERERLYMEDSRNRRR